MSPSKPGFVTRSVKAGQRLASLNEAERSVEFVATTSDKVSVWDWESWSPIDEVLLMSGRQDPPSGQVPLLDTHDNTSVEKQLGSFRQIRTEGQTTIGRAYFSQAEESAFLKVKEGHVTDCSVGYAIEEYATLKEGESGEYDGLTISGPCRVVTKWELKELSLCPIGADPRAKARADKFKEKVMKGKKGRMEATTEEEQILDDDLTETVEEVLDEAAQDLKDELEAVVEENLDEEREDEEEEETRDDESEGEDDEKEERKKRAAAKLAKRAILAERSRIAEIDDLCRSFALPDSSRQMMVNKGLSANQARKAVFAVMKKRGQRGPAYGSVRVLNDAGQNFKQRALDSLILRSGRSLEKPAPGAQELRGYSLRELARECLRQCGKSAPSGAMEMVGRALTTTDLPVILTEASQRFMLEGFDEAQETWPLWTGEGSVNDFKDIKLVSTGLDNELEEIPEHGEYSYAGMAEEAQTVRVVTYGRKFAISRQAIINDDLGALTDIPARMGEGANSLIGDGVYGVLIANSTMYDGLALFCLKHQNLLTGGGIPTVEKLGAAVTAMGLQKNMAGKRLNIKPEFFLAPLSLQVSAETFFNSEMIGTSDFPTTRNIYHGSFNRVYEPRLDDDSTENWFLCGPANKGVKVFYLNGVKTPYLETREGWDIDGVEHKVRMDVGVVATSWRGLAKSAK